MALLYNSEGSGSCTEKTHHARYRADGLPYLALAPEPLVCGCQEKRLAKAEGEVGALQLKLCRQRDKTDEAVRLRNECLASHPKREAVLNETIAGLERLLREANERLLAVQKGFTWIDAGQQPNPGKVAELEAKVAEKEKTIDAFVKTDNFLRARLATVSSELRNEKARIATLQDGTAALRRDLDDQIAATKKATEERDEAKRGVEMLRFNAGEWQARAKACSARLDVYDNLRIFASQFESPQAVNLARGIVGETLIVAMRNDHAEMIEEIRALRSALRDLMAEQNGPPLIRDERKWTDAMNRAAELLDGKAEEARKGLADRVQKTCEAFEAVEAAERNAAKVGRVLDGLDKEGKP